ncbi:hypothetical protein GP486_006754 [Trichoglossum hirsutum]|uniref:Clr5 domain-containing protein n=1 Tax=Trichoglossum hirsutum TaxID=265104 RepID=A0A9P8L3E4_9PEZI|nr:hypothetical protein GP486_006754 [Trichoglossum hirsutum]
MVYDWEDKEDICYRMYIEEKKSLEEIMEFMKTERTVVRCDAFAEPRRNARNSQPFICMISQFSPAKTDTDKECRSN